MTATTLYREIASSATPAQIEQATQWYADAEMLAHELVDIYSSRNIKMSLENTASIISSFSPRQRWSVNMRQAIRFAHGDETMRCLPNNLKMARQSEKLGFNALNGLKTNAFARAVSGDDNAVTIDVWMMRSAGMDKDTPTKRQYEELSNSVREVAKEFKMTPRTMQALIWIVYRGSAE